jgi:hypothetical protein
MRNTAESAKPDSKLGNRWVKEGKLMQNKTSGQHRNSPNQLTGGCTGLLKKNRNISREASGPC